MKDNLSVIGFIVGISEERNVSEKLVLFIKIGFGGGFTTFSTFSLESLTLLNEGKYLTGYTYMVLSLGVCVVGVAIGRLCAKKVA